MHGDTGAWELIGNHKFEILNTIFPQKSRKQINDTIGFIIINLKACLSKIESTWALRGLSSASAIFHLT